MTESDLDRVLEIERLCFSPPWLREKYGIDLTEELKETRKDLWVQELPDELLEGHSELLMDAANSLGYHWTKFGKMIDAKKCRKNCSDCMLTCPTGAKWTSRVYLEEAKKNGATVITNVTVPRTSRKRSRKGCTCQKRFQHRRISCALDHPCGWWPGFSADSAKDGHRKSRSRHLHRPTDRGRRCLFRSSPCRWRKIQFAHVRGHLGILQI